VWVSVRRVWAVPVELEGDERVGFVALAGAAFAPLVGEQVGWVAGGNEALHGAVDVLAARADDEVEVELEEAADAEIDCSAGEPGLEVCRVGEVAPDEIGGAGEQALEDYGLLVGEVA